MQQILTPDIELVRATCGWIHSSILRLNSDRDNSVCGDGKIIHTAGKGVVRMHVLGDDERSSLAT